jgi:hypothetical protein
MKSNRIGKIDSTKVNPTDTRAYGGPQVVGIDYDTAVESMVLYLDSPSLGANARRSYLAGRTDLGSVTGSPAVNFATAASVKLTAGGNLTPTFAGGVKGGTYQVEVKQDGTGSRLVTWPAAVVWPGGTPPTLTTTAARSDIFKFYFNGTNYLGSTVGLNYTTAG